MKKFALILLICSYCLSSSGIGVKQSFCCGQLNHVCISLIQGSVNIKEHNGCTKTIFKNFKVSDSHFAARYILSPNNFFNQLSLFFTYQGAILLVTVPIHPADTSLAPPLFQNIPVYILN